MVVFVRPDPRGPSLWLARVGNRTPYGRSNPLSLRLQGTVTGTQAPNPWRDPWGVRPGVRVTPYPLW